MQIRTDLAVESSGLEKKPKGVSVTRLHHGKIEEIQVTVETVDAARTLEKAQGTYITLFHPLLSHADSTERLTMIHALADALKKLLPPFGDILVIGLGNRYMTADALGSRVLESLLITRHVKDVVHESISNRLRSVCAAAPGVLGITGIETAEMVRGMAEHVRPAAIIAIDALAARESSRICTTIQVTDTGILPGSGVGNHREGLTKDSLGIPVIAIGVPMVVYAAVIARDALSLLLDDLGISEEEHEKAIEGMVQKITRQGLGELVVTPREVDELVGKVARIIADGVNLALQTELSEEEIQLFSHDEM